MESSRRVTNGRSQSIGLVALFALSTLYLVPVFPHHVSVNEFTRWATVAGAVERGTLDVRWSEPLLGVLHDVSPFGNHVYSNKAPGLALLSAPGYLVARLVLGPPTGSNMRWSLYAMRVVGVTLPTILLGWLFLRRDRPDPFALGTLLFATPVFIYGTLLFSHATAAALLYAGYRAAFSTSRTARHLLLAGALCGVGTLAEYPVAAATIAIGLGLLLEKSPGRVSRTALFVAGGLPFAAALGLYNRMLFGSFFSLSTAHEGAEDVALQASRGVFGLMLPTISGTFTLLASPARGLFFYSPVLIVGALAVLASATRGSTRERVRLAIAVTLVVAFAGFPFNHGGWCLGSRYIVAVVPFLVEAASERDPEAPNPVSALLFGASAVLCVVPMLTIPFPPAEIPFVHPGFVRPFLAEGFLSPSLGSFAVAGPLSLAPVLLALLAALFLTVRAGGRGAILGAALGFLLAVGYAALPIRQPKSHVILEAFILDTFFVDTGRLSALSHEEMRPEDRASLISLTAMSAEKRRLGPDDWPYR